MLEVTGMYDHAVNAERAFNALKAQGFLDESFGLVAPTAAQRLWIVTIRPPFGTGGIATEILDSFSPIARTIHHQRDREPGLDAIARLSGPVSPGAIATLSRSRSPGAISTLSRSRSPGAISTLSRSRSPGAISRLSRSRSPGAISTLSRSRPTGAISRLSAGWFLSNLFGLPLLTRSQGPIEPDDSLVGRSIPGDGANQLHETTVI